MNSPQAKTRRYVTNLLTRGENHNFKFTDLRQATIEKDGLVLGWYYTATVWNKTFPFSQDASCVGITPEQAVRRALEKHGVTFR